MRLALLRIFVAIGLVTSAVGCAAIHGLDDFTTAERPAPTAEGPGETLPLENETPAASECVRNADCIDATELTPSDLAITMRVPAPRVCVKATGKCQRLFTEDCPRVVGDYASDDAVLVGTLLSDAGPSALERAAFLAAEELETNAGGLPGKMASSPARPLVVLGCNVQPDAMRATRHLAEDLRVPAIIGPMSGEQVVEVTQQISVKAGTLLMTPTSLASAISNLADSDLTWRVTPSDAQRAKLVIGQISDLESLLRATRGLTTVKLGIAHSTDAMGMSVRDAISGKLILNNRFITDAANQANVSVDGYQPGNAAAQKAIATKYASTLRPDIVFITAAEQISNLLVPLEQALTAARAPSRPYYVITDAARTDELLAAAAGTEVPPDLKRRIRGVGIKPDTSSLPVFQDFRSAYAARYGAAQPTPPAALSYDALYAIAYALTATSATPPSGASVAHGLRTLAVGSAVSVGAKGLLPVLRDLSSGKSVSLRGTFGLMHWDAAGDIAAGTIEVWCLGSVDGAPAFGSSGLTMDVETQVVGGAFVQCQ